MSGQGFGNNIRYKIIDRSQQYDQDNSAVLAIGLGGTGIECLRILKAKVYERLRPDNPDDVVPRYDHVKFLAVDTDSVGMNKASRTDMGALDLHQEFFDISYTGKLSDLFEEQRESLADSLEYREWLQFGRITDAGTANNGASGVRQIGRYLLVRRADHFVLTVTNLIGNILIDPNGNKRKVYVHIFSGLGGGTGSGTFLDACYLVRKALRDVNAGSNNVMGYFFLPDVNLAQTSIPSDTKEYIKLNGYAAMQELDYCMGFGLNGDKWHQAYPGMGELHFREKPVDYCHLVAGKTAGGASLPEAYNHAMNVVADYVMDFLARPADIKFNLESHLSNVGALKAQAKSKQDIGASYDYLVLGASSVIVPHGNIMNYLASNFFRRLGHMRSRVPTKNEVEEFQKDVGLTGDALLEKLRRGVKVDPEQLDFHPARAHEKNPNVEDRYEHLESVAKKSLDTNLSNLSSEVDGYVHTELSSDDSAHAVMAKVVNAVLDAMADPDRGPWYAAALVRSAKGTDLLAAVQGIKGGAEKERDYQEAQDHEGMDIWDNFDKARSEFFAAPVIPLIPDNGLRQRYDEFVSKTCELTQCRIKKDLYQALVNLASKLDTEIKSLANKLTDPFERAMGKVLDIFDGWWTYFTSFDDGASTYERPIVTMQQITPTLIKELDEVDISHVGKELFGILLEQKGREAWYGGDSDDTLLVHLVSEFFLDRFSTWSQKTLKAYLEEKYNIYGNPQMLAQAVQNDLLNNMHKRASVLFDPSVGYSLPLDNSALCYITVPQSTKEVVNAAKDFVKIHGNGFSVRETFVTDRISLLRVKVGVPLWGYGSIGLYEAEQYKAGQGSAPGRHLYERSENVEGVSDSNEVKISRDWRELPSPVPRSKMGASTSTEVRDHADEVARAFDEALHECIVIRMADGYIIRTISDKFMKDVRTTYRAARGLPIVNKVKVQTTLKNMNANRSYDPKELLLSNVLRPANKKVEQVICVDFLVKAPVLTKIVLSELEKCHEIAGYIEDLVPKVDHDLESFRKALFAGVIAFSNPVVQYVDGGYDGPIVLSNRLFDHGTIPLYQAFLSFKDESVLVPAMREAIEAQTKNILTANQIPDDVQGACDAVQRELDRGHDLISIAASKFPHEVDDVKGLLEDLRRELAIFRLMYQIPAANPSTN